MPDMSAHPSRLVPASAYPPAADLDSRGFARLLLGGRFRPELLDAPEPDPKEEARAEAFLSRLEVFAREHIDGNAIDRNGHVPEEVLDGLRELGAFGIKIPREYGGLGLSQRSYARALTIVASRCGSTGAYLSAHQSIGVPGPLLMFGTEEQKRRYLPRLAGGELSAFALTEVDVGSDPAHMSTTAERSSDGSHWILNGEKLWTTNGPRADIIVVMASTPPKEGSSRRKISAFIVETAWEGVETTHHCSFMGLRGISNGLLRFTDVKVPEENLLWAEGRGLKLALITLNTGRLSLPAFCVAGGKASLGICRSWANERIQWGRPIGRHDAIAQMLGRMAADTFAMEALVEVSSRVADGHRFDIRLEAAIAKLWATEAGLAIAHAAMQIRGGRGYETHDSLVGRGEVGHPVERILRDMRINTIFEGSSEIMRLFLARELVGEQLAVFGDLLRNDASARRKLASLARAALHYAWWYPSRYLGWPLGPGYRRYGRLAGHLRFVDSMSRRLARSVVHALVRYGASLKRRQAVLFRMVEVGSELFVMTATVLYARELGEPEAERLADLFCRHAGVRVRDRFDALFDNDDVATYELAQQVLEGDYAWLEEGIVSVFTPPVG